MSRTITIRVSDPLYTELLQVVDRERQATGYPVTISSYLNKAIKEYLQEHETESVK